MGMDAEQQAVIDKMLAQAKRSKNATLVQPKQAILGNPSNRNYGAMRPEKLRRCIQELRLGYGDAHRRCVIAGGDPKADLAKAERTLKAMGY